MALGNLAPSPVGDARAAPRLSCGIAMCTCNAGSFLQPQLDSIAAQTRLPSHIVVSDDRSDDDTWERLQAWASTMGAQRGIRVTVIRNESRLGVARNFEQAIKRLETDVVFLADQDDVWAKTKMEVLMEVFESERSILLAHSDAWLIDERGENLGKSLFQALRLSPVEQELVKRRCFFEVYCRRNLVTGTTAAFRRELLQLALPFPDDWVHDEWLAACAAGCADVAMLPAKLTEYRQHGTNAIGVPITEVSRLMLYVKRVAKTPRDEYLRYKFRRLDALRRRLQSCSGVPSERLALLEDAQNHFARRLRFGRTLSARFMSVIRESRSRGYHRFADGLAGMVRDLIHF